MALGKDLNYAPVNPDMVKSEKFNVTHPCFEKANGFPTLTLSHPP